MEPFSKIDRRWRGAIAYLSDEADDRGRARGHELFSVSAHADGTKTLRASCVIDDPPHIVRDVVQTVDAAMRPRECFVQLRVGGAFAGSGWFAWRDGWAGCEADTATEGRVSQRMACADGPRGFCNHAIVGDAWMAANHPRRRAGDSFTLAQMFTPSLNKQGSTGPLLARTALDIVYRGTERVTVPAGTFTTLSFRFTGAEADGNSTAPEYEMWTTDDGCYSPVLSMYRGRRRYELVELVQD